MPKLSLVPKRAPTAVESVRKRIRAGTALQCRCGCRELIETKTGVELVDGKPQGGTKIYICAACALKGERVVVA